MNCPNVHHYRITVTTGSITGSIPCSVQALKMTFSLCWIITGQFANSNHPMATLHTIVTGATKMGSLPYAPCPLAKPLANESTTPSNPGICAAAATHARCDYAFVQHCQTMPQAAQCWKAGSHTPCPLAALAICTPTPTPPWGPSAPHTNAPCSSGCLRPSHLRPLTANNLPDQLFGEVPQPEPVHLHRVQLRVLAVRQGTLTVEAARR